MAAPPNNKPSALLSSSSSPPVPCRSSPRPRNSESGDPMRRSFGGNPFPTGKPAVVAHHKGFHNPSTTPANSPSDFSRRNSFGRESNRYESGDKENDKDQFTNISKAPQTTKGAKNFMSPTISAVSKINASPRKKVLAEKNEGNRSSISFSDVRGLLLEETKNHPTRPSVSFSDVVSIIGEDKKELKPDMEDQYDITVTDLYQKVALNLQNGSEPRENVVEEKKGGADFDSSFTISSYPTVISSTVAPIDTDPVMSPYDPKKNYLSPRPQFLHYRPNPRVEHYFDECKQLEDTLSSESSDTEASKDERDSGNSEDGASQEGESIPEKEEIVLGYDDDEDMETWSDEETVGESIKADQIPKPRRYRVLKILGWVMVLVVAYFSVSATISPPPREPSGLHDFYISNEFKESAKANFEQFSVKLKMWSVSSSAYIAKMISSSIGEEEEGWLQFHNLTGLLEDGSFHTFLQPSKAEISVSGSHYTSVVRPIEEEADEKDFEVEEQLKQESVSENNFKDVSLEDKGINAETISLQVDNEAKASKYDEKKLEITKSADTYKDEQAFEVIGDESSSEALLGDNGREETHDIWNRKGKEESEIISEEDAHEEKLRNIECEASYKVQQEETEAQFESEELEQTAETTDVDIVTETDAELDLRPEIGSSIKVENDLEESGLDVDMVIETEAELDLRPEIGSSIEVENDLVKPGPEVSAELTEISEGNQSVLVLSSTLVVVVLAAASAFFLTKKAKPVKQNETASASEPMPITEELNFNHVPVNNIIKERLFLPDFQTEIDDRIRESCPTEMSSSFEKRNSNKDVEEPNEAHSWARKSSKKNSNSSRNPRRVSLASSTSDYSIGSASYGSFTTYEKIPLKSGLMDEDVVTPVRRSSRLRSQHSAH